MGFGQAIVSCFAKFFTFAGRAPRSEYWYFYLFFVLTAIVGGVLDVAIGTTVFDENDEYAGGLLLFLVIFALLIPQISVTVRRLHDIDRSGWWWWLCLVPFIGGIVLLVWACTPGTEDDNRFGPNPLHPVALAVFD